MIEAADIWNLGIALVIVIPVALMISFIAFLIQRDSQGESVSISLPRIVPWSVAAKARRIRAEVELEEAKRSLYSQKHQTLQKQIVLHDLENEQFKRALEQSND